MVAMKYRAIKNKSKIKSKVVYILAHYMPPTNHA